MTITVPPAINYPGSLISYPSNWMKSPRETPRMIPIEIDWSIMGGDNNSVVINLQNITVNPISQIVALSIDNSLCAADISFFFSDTSETVPIPAYANKVVLPVFTNGIEFYVVAPGAQGGDITRFSILNTMPPPITVPFTIEQLAAINGSISTGAASSTPLIPAGVSGTLEAAQLQFSVENAGALGAVDISLVDGNGTILGICTAFVNAGGTVNEILLNLSNIHIRFLDGINAVVHSGGGTYIAGGQFNTNLYYRAP